MRHWARIIMGLLGAGVVILTILSLPGLAAQTPLVPGLQPRERTLLRIWVMSSPGGGQSWLAQQLRAFEKQHPGVRTHLRIVRPEEINAPDAVLPDVLLFMPGDLTDTSPLTPVTTDPALRPELLCAGRDDDTQLALPLCWGAWVMAIDSAIEPGPATPPAPTTLLGRPAAPPDPTDAPGYPLDAASAADVPLQSPGGAALMTLAALLPQEARPPLPDDFAQLSSAAVYDAFRAHRCATAMLTTGQATALTGLASSGSGFPFRVMAPTSVVTDLVWFAGLTEVAPEAAHALLSSLTGADAQKALAAQGLHTVRDDLTLYAAGFSQEVEQAGRTKLSAVNAFLSDEEASSLAWQAFQGTVSYNEALAALL